jgi:hypothetical protein
MPRRIKDLHEAYLDLHLIGAKEKNPERITNLWKTILLPPEQRVRWKPWTLWGYTGYTASKLTTLIRTYWNWSFYDRAIEIMDKYMTCKGTRQFSFTIHLGIEDAEMIEQNKRWGKHGKHQMGGCMIDVTFYFTPYKEKGEYRWKVNPVIHWRASELTRRMAADLILIENIFHWVLDRYDLYDSLDFVTLSFGSMGLSWCTAILADYMFPGISEIIYKTDELFAKSWATQLERQTTRGYTRDEKDPNYFKYGPTRNAVRAFEVVKEAGLPPMFQTPLSKKRLSPGAKLDDFPLRPLKKERDAEDKRRRKKRKKK